LHQDTKKKKRPNVRSWEVVGGKEYRKERENIGKTGGEANGSVGVNNPWESEGGRIAREIEAGESKKSDTKSYQGAQNIKKGRHT